MTAPDALRGLRLLVVEDEAIVAMMIEDMLADLGCIVAASAASIGNALALARSTPLDGAVLDINVAGAPVYPVAEALADRGVPFVFTTGYDPSGIDPRFAHAPIVRKPFELPELQRALAAGMLRGGLR